MFKFIVEFCPLIAFFIGYRAGGILEATMYLLVATVVGIVISYIKERKINKVSLVSSVLLLISASLTLFSGNSIFIKMKPTVLYCMFAMVFLVTNFKWKPAIQYALGSAIKFKETKNWRILNLRFMWFFLLMALVNEYMWRNFPEDTWVSFKVFGAMPITLIFIISQMPFIMKHKLADDASSS